MNNTQINILIKEVRGEQHISPMEDDDVLMGYIKDGEYDINDYCGTKIDYEKDLQAKSLLKNYVQYARYGRLAEFKQLYIGEYTYLQAKYYKPTNV